jgi:hypothetical protein
MTTAMPQSLPALTPMPDTSVGTAIVPPPNPTVLYFTTLIHDGTPELVLQMQHGNRVNLEYDDRWTKLPTTLVVQVPTGWTIIATDTNITWTGDAPIWIGQIAAQTIDDVLHAKKPPVHSSFTIYDPVKKKGHDPVVVIGRDG